MERRKSSLRLFGTTVVTLLFGLLFAQGLYAQVDTGAILGTVRDQSGAVVPGAKVTVTNEGTAFANSTVTGSDGTYVFTPLRIGTYTVSAEFQGFQKAQRNHITVDVQQQVVVDFSMVPGAVTQTVEVTAAAPLLQTTNGSVGNVVNGQTINNLPLNGRNWTFLAQTATGVTIGQQEGRGLDASGDFSANGNRPAQNNYLLDGIDNNINLVDFLNGTAFVVLPSVDAISEFKIQTTDYAAEIGRAGGAVLNATIKSGTNQFHGDAWEFVRNDVFDANDFFINAAHQKKPEFRLNQFGFTAGGPIIIPHVYDGRNKTFIFGDLEFTRRRQGTTFVTTVPTAAERASGYTNFADLIALQGCSRGTDLLGRGIPCGTIYDPATTRSVTSGAVDPVTGLTATGNGFVRDPISCNGVANTLCASRIDPNAVKLLNLFPAPTQGGIFNNFTTSPVVQDNGRRFDIRADHNFSDKDQMFARFSYLDEPQLKPGPFGGIADGGGFNQGSQTAGSSNSALSWTHSFSPTLINEARFGFAFIHTSRIQSNGNTLGIPAQFGIQGVVQSPQNGGLPQINIGSLSQIGSSNFLVSNEYNSTSQLTENLTKIYHSHTFKGGIEFQHIKFSTLQPPWSRGSMGFGGNYTSIPKIGDGSTGIAQLLLLPVNPVTAGTPNGVNAVQGGANDTRISNMANVDDGHNYYGGYFQDDWKVSQKLTLNLGLRWDYFAQVEENFGGQGNLIPGAPGAGAQYLIPIQRKNRPSLSPSFVNLLAADGISLVYTPNAALGNSQSTNFAPRLGFAYQATQKLVVRGGYGIFYGGFENRGFSPNLGENYPFQFDFHFTNPNDWTPNTYADGSVATLEQGYLSVPLNPGIVVAEGLSLRGIQFNYITPYTQGFNLTFQYQLTPNETFSLGYVGSLARHLETFPGSNQVSQILPAGICTHNPNCAAPHVPYPDFGQGSSYAATEGSSAYHSLQATFERRFSAGLNFNANYTYGKVLSDARDLLNGDIGGWRAPYLSGFGIVKDYALADFDVRNIFHLSGGWEFPVGHGKHWLTDSSGVENAILGGWSTHASLVLQDGQPFTVGCIRGTTSGLGCNAMLVPGQNVIGGPHNVNQWMNPAAFTQPCQLSASGPTLNSPPNCIPETGVGVLGGAFTQLVGPGFHRLEWSLFKDVKTSETTHLQFRSEFFNLTNHPNFALPSGRNFQFNDLTKSGHFGQITSTRDNPNDPREIQFALKFYW
ncbi:MAG: TonB-dependent receptor domain-containing protein [Terriglobia bacterium]